MGQQMGVMPNTWENLMEERDRVLHWSGEILAKVDDNVQSEDTFLMDYDDDKIDNKIKRWIDLDAERVNQVYTQLPNISDACKNQIKSKIDKVEKEIKAKLQKEYRSAYAEIKNFTKKVDKFGKEEKQIHEKIQKLEAEAANDVKKFQKKFGPLRVKVFDNLTSGEKFIFTDKRLKEDFVKKIHEIDTKISADCVKKFDKLVQEAEKCPQN